MRLIGDRAAWLRTKQAAARERFAARRERCAGDLQDILLGDSAAEVKAASIKLTPYLEEMRSWDAVTWLALDRGNMQACPDAD